MNNPRKNMDVYSLWLNENEARILKDALNANMDNLVGSIIDKANKRGDLEKR